MNSLLLARALKLFFRMSPLFSILVIVLSYWPACGSVADNGLGYTGSTDYGLDMAVRLSFPHPHQPPLSLNTRHHPTALASDELSARRMFCTTRKRG